VGRVGNAARVVVMLLYLSALVVAFAYGLPYVLDRV
jgi:hypothetical protein